jgi:phosphatidate cytidylyltransferase
LYRMDAWLLLAAMALVWIADIAAYFCGRAFGRNKLAPSISPGKTREGAFGALLAVLVYGFVLALKQWPDASAERLAGVAVVLLLLTVLSIVGDLFESLLKRQAGIKDSSNLLPGHGGVLDRIDSLTSTLPLVALYFFWMAQ